MRIATYDYYTHTHSINVAIYALSLGSFLNFKSDELSELGEAALLHDLGKSKVDTSIINKNGKLSDKEFQEIKKHPALGYTIGLKLGIKNRKVLEGIRHHHEKMNGTGYPFGMRGESIPYYARIIAICDIFDALTSKRSYKESMSSFEAFLLMKTKMKGELDTELLNNMIKMFS
jgi:HD-GYP domain-containing protein (c-di-GMP phosphodiesterase class II)